MQFFEYISIKYFINIENTVLNFKQNRMSSALYLCLDFIPLCNTLILVKLSVHCGLFLFVEIKTKSTIQTNSVVGINMLLFQWEDIFIPATFKNCFSSMIVLLENGGLRKQIMYNGTTDCMIAYSGGCFRHYNTVPNKAVECPRR